MYLILMYLIPVTQFLNDVPTSDVSKSVTSLTIYPKQILPRDLDQRPAASVVGVGDQK